MICNPIVEINNLFLQYGNRTVIQDFSLILDRGEKVVIYGESGSGKSSLFRILLGFELNYSGKIVADRSDISLVPQEISIPVDTLEEASDQLFSLKVNRHLKPKDSEIIKLLNRLGLEIKSLKKPLYELSGGERQRFFIALGLLLKKPLLLLDEPTSALDPQSISLLIEVLREMSTGMLAISHDDSFSKSFDRKVLFTRTKHTVHGNS